MGLVKDHAFFTGPIAPSYTLVVPCHINIFAIIVHQLGLHIVQLSLALQLFSHHRKHNKAGLKIESFTSKRWII